MPGRSKALGGISHTAGYFKRFHSVFVHGFGCVTGVEHPGCVLSCAKTMCQAQSWGIRPGDGGSEKAAGRRLPSPLFSLHC